MNDYTAKYALKMLIETKGIEHLKNGNQCMAFLKDMASKDKEGLENIQVVFDRHLQQLLIDASFGSNTDQQNAIDIIYNRLIDRFSMQTTKEICSIFAFALNWNVVIESSDAIISHDDNKAVPPVTPLQSKKQNPIPVIRNKAQSLRKVKIIVGVVFLLAVIAMGTSLLVARKHVPSEYNSEIVTDETNLKATTSNEPGASIEDTTVLSEFVTDSEVNTKTAETIAVESTSIFNNNIPEDAVVFNGHSYYGYSYGISWEEAESYCNSLDGHLISINSAEEQELALEIAKSIGKDNIWAGGYYLNGKWGWSDSTDFTYTNWDSREVYDNILDEMLIFEQPDNYSGDEYYIRFVSRDIDYPDNDWWANEGKWNDTAMNGDGDAPLSSFGFICEWS